MIQTQEVVGFPGYAATLIGQIFGKRLHKLLPDYPSGGKRQQYRVVRFSVGGIRATRALRRVILETFVDPRPKGMECRHLDGNPRNNHLYNLCWGTPEENRADIKRHKTLRQFLYGGCGNNG